MLVSALLQGAGLAPNVTAVCWKCVCPHPELLSPCGALFQMWMSASPSHVRMEPPASMVLAGSPAGALQASEATTAKLVSSEALKKQRLQA